MTNNLKNENLESNNEIENSFFIDVNNLEQDNSEKKDNKEGLFGKKEDTNIEIIEPKEEEKTLQKGKSIGSTFKGFGKKKNKEKQDNNQSGNYFDDNLVENKKEEKKDDIVDDTALIKFLKKIKADKKYRFYISAGFGGVLLIIFLLFVSLAFYENYKLNKKSGLLKNINTYQFNELVNKIETQHGIKGIKDGEINNLIDAFEESEISKQKITNNFSRLQAPYNKFLKHKFLPSLNIWEDPFTQKINTDIIGDEFLKRNPYLDTNLLDSRGTFFKKIDGDDTALYNNITDIKIGKIIQEKNNFNMLVEVSFESPSRSSFLMLVNKLSITSNKKNISIINELMFYIWKNIKSEYYSNIIKSLEKINKNELNSLKDKMTKFDSYEDLGNININPDAQKDIESLNTFVGELFYRNFFEHDKQIDCKKENNDGNIFFNQNKSVYSICSGGIENEIIKEAEIINNTIIEMAVEEMVKCNKGDITKGTDNSKANCYFKFREYTSNISNISYTIGQDNSTNKLNDLKTFIRGLPPIMDIVKFSFQENNRELVGENEFKYKGDVSIKIYGSLIENASLSKIQKQLGEICFTDKSKSADGKQTSLIEPKLGLDLVTKEISGISKSGELESKRMIDLIELENILSELNKKYNSYNTYEKTIKSFEVYRMLDSIDLCK